MIELRKSKMWYDGLDTNPGVDRPWDSIAKGLHKFICFGPGDAGNGSSDGGSAADFEAAIAEAPTGLASVATGALGGDPTSKSQSDDTGPSDAATDSLGSIGSGEFGHDIDISTLTFDDFDKGHYTPSLVNKTGQEETFALIPSLFSGIVSYLTNSLPPVAIYNAVTGVSNIIGGLTGSKAAKAVGDLSLSSLANQGLTALGNQLGLDVSFLTDDILAVESKPTQTSLTSPVLGIQGPAIPIGTDVLSPVQNVVSDIGKSLGITDETQQGITSGFPSQATINSQGQVVSTQSTTPPPIADPALSNINNFDDASPDPRPRGIVSALQNPLEVRPQEEILPTDDSEGGLRRIIRRPFVFTPGRIFAQTGGGIQDLIDKQPTLIDVVNKGMSIPEETIPSQRPKQFIKGQQQPGGLRSTNYYTNAMQPASFYAQPQQVRNYGSIY